MNLKVHQKDLFKVMDVEVEEIVEPIKRDNRNSSILETRVFAAEDVKSLRAKLNVSQKVFAKLMGASIRMIEYWESGTKKTSGTANRLMQIYDMDPELPEALGLLEEQE